MSFLCPSKIHERSLRSCDRRYLATASASGFGSTGLFRSILCICGCPGFGGPPGCPFAAGCPPCCACCCACLCAWMASCCFMARNCWGLMPALAASSCNFFCCIMMNCWGVMPAFAASASRRFCCIIWICLNCSSVKLCFLASAAMRCSISSGESGRPPTIGAPTDGACSAGRGGP